MNSTPLIINNCDSLLPRIFEDSSPGLREILTESDPLFGENSFDHPRDIRRFKLEQERKIDGQGICSLEIPCPPLPSSVFEELRTRFLQGCIRTFIYDRSKTEKFVQHHSKIKNLVPGCCMEKFLALPFLQFDKVEVSYSFVEKDLYDQLILQTTQLMTDQREVFPGSIIHDPSFEIDLIGGSAKKYLLEWMATYFSQVTGLPKEEFSPPKLSEEPDEDLRFVAKNLHFLFFKNYSETTLKYLAKQIYEAQSPPIFELTHPHYNEFMNLFQTFIAFTALEKFYLDSSGIVESVVVSLPGHTQKPLDLLFMTLVESRRRMFVKDSLSIPLNKVFDFPDSRFSNESPITPLLIDGLPPIQSIIDTHLGIIRLVKQSQISARFFPRALLNQVEGDSFIDSTSENFLLDLYLAESEKEIFSLLKTVYKTHRANQPQVLKAMLIRLFTLLTEKKHSKTYQLWVLFSSIFPQETHSSTLIDVFFEKMIEDFSLLPHLLALFELMMYLNANSHCSEKPRQTFLTAQGKQLTWECVENGLSLSKKCNLQASLSHLLTISDEKIKQLLPIILSLRPTHAFDFQWITPFKQHHASLGLSLEELEKFGLKFLNHSSPLFQQLGFELLLSKNTVLLSQSILSVLLEKFSFCLSGYSTSQEKTRLLNCLQNIIIHAVPTLNISQPLFPSISILVDPATPHRAIAPIVAQDLTHHFEPLFANYAFNVWTKISDLKNYQTLSLQLFNHFIPYDFSKALRIFVKIYTLKFLESDQATNFLNLLIKKYYQTKKTPDFIESQVLFCEIIQLVIEDLGNLSLSKEFLQSFVIFYLDLLKSPLFEVHFYPSLEKALIFLQNLAAYQLSEEGFTLLEAFNERKIIFPFNENFVRLIIDLCTSYPIVNPSFIHIKLSHYAFYKKQPILLKEEQLNLYFSLLEHLLMQKEFQYAHTWIDRIDALIKKDDSLREIRIYDKQSLINAIKLLANENQYSYAERLSLLISSWIPLEFRQLSRKLPSLVSISSPASSSIETCDESLRRLALSETFTFKHWKEWKILSQTLSGEPIAECGIKILSALRKSKNQKLVELLKEWPILHEHFTTLSSKLLAFEVLKILYFGSLEILEKINFRNPYMFDLQQILEFIMAEMSKHSYEPLVIEMQIARFKTCFVETSQSINFIFSYYELTKFIFEASFLSRFPSLSSTLVATLLEGGLFYTTGEWKEGHSDEISRVFNHFFKSNSKFLIAGYLLPTLTENFIMLDSKRKMESDEPWITYCFLLIQQQFLKNGNQIQLAPILRVITKYDSILLMTLAGGLFLKYLKNMEISKNSSSMGHPSDTTQESLSELKVETYKFLKRLARSTYPKSHQLLLDCLTNPCLQDLISNSLIRKIWMTQAQTILLKASQFSSSLDIEKAIETFIHSANVISIGQIEPTDSSDLKLIDLAFECLLTILQKENNRLLFLKVLNKLLCGVSQKQTLKIPHLEVEEGKKSSLDDLKPIDLQNDLLHFSKLVIFLQDVEVMQTYFLRFVHKLASHTFSEQIGHYLSCFVDVFMRSAIENLRATKHNLFWSTWDDYLYSPLYQKDCLFQEHLNYARKLFITIGSHPPTAAHFIEYSSYLNGVEMTAQATALFPLFDVSAPKFTPSFIKILHQIETRPIHSPCVLFHLLEIMMTYPKVFFDEPEHIEELSTKLIDLVKNCPNILSINNRNFEPHIRFFSSQTPYLYRYLINFFLHPFFWQEEHSSLSEKLREKLLQAFLEVKIEFDPREKNLLEFYEDILFLKELLSKKNEVTKDLNWYAELMHNFFSSIYIPIKYGQIKGDSISKYTENVFASVKKINVVEILQFRRPLSSSENTTRLGFFAMWLGQISHLKPYITNKATLEEITNFVITTYNAALTQNFFSEKENRRKEQQKPFKKILSQV